MSQNAPQPLHSNHDHPHLGRFLLVSLVVHVLTVALLVGGWFDSPHQPKPQAYFVDLVHKPVLNPQAGRPEPRPATKAPAVPKQKVRPQVKPKPEPETVKTVAPAKPAPPAVAPKPAPQPDLQAEQQRRAAIEELRAQQALQEEIENIRQRLATRQQQQATEVNANVPVGMPDGKGDEIGVSVLSHIQAFIQQNWALSPYLLDRARIGTIEARVLLAYSAEGTLSRYRIVEPSGDEQFDDSIKRAIIKSKQLQQKLPRSTELTVVFNLKEMAAIGR